MGQVDQNLRPVLPILLGQVAQAGGVFDFTVQVDAELPLQQLGDGLFEEPPAVGDGIAEGIAEGFVHVLQFVHLIRVAIG